MKKPFMEESGVINKQVFSKNQQYWGALSVLLDFPDETMNLAQVHRQLSEAPVFEGKEELLSAVQQMAATPIIELQESYTDLFELNKQLTLYLTYYKLRDSRKRGEVLAQLCVLYEQNGLKIQQAELADYLPLMLEFLSFLSPEEAEAKELSLLYSILEDGTHELLKEAAEHQQEPYIQLIKYARHLLQQAFTEEVIS